MQPPAMPTAEELGQAMRAAAARMPREGRPEEDSHERKHRIVLAPFIGDLSNRRAFLNDVVALYRTLGDWPQTNGWPGAFPLLSSLSFPEVDASSHGPPGLWHRYLLPGDDHWWAFFLLGLRLRSEKPEEGAGLQVRQAVHAGPLSLEFKLVRAHGPQPMLVTELWFDFRATQDERRGQIRSALAPAFPEFAQSLKGRSDLIGANRYHPGEFSLLAHLSLPGKAHAFESASVALKPTQRWDAWLTGVVEVVDTLWGRARTADWFPVSAESASGEPRDLLGDPRGVDPRSAVIGNLVRSYWAPHVFAGEDPPQPGTDEASVCEWWTRLFGARRAPR